MHICPLPRINDVHDVMEKGVVYLRDGVDVFVYGIA